MRKQYTIDELNRDQLLENPTDMFRKWFEEVEALDDIEPNAMALATASEKGKPSNRRLYCSRNMMKKDSYFTLITKVKKVIRLKTIHMLH